MITFPAVSETLGFDFRLVSPAEAAGMYQMGAVIRLRNGQIARPTAEAAQAAVRLAEYGLDLGLAVAIENDVPNFEIIA